MIAQESRLSLTAHFLERALGAISSSARGGDMKTSLHSFGRAKDSDLKALEDLGYLVTRDRNWYEISWGME